MKMTETNLQRAGQPVWIFVVGYLFEFWSLVLVWNLGIGIWDFIFGVYRGA
jgi:hypothetical protein